MFQVRFHGNGGQGVVDRGARLLAVAAFNDGRHAQAFPSFGAERSGAPVASFCRISETRRSGTRAPIDEPDALVIQDATLLHELGLFSGVKPQGYVVVNTAKTLEELGVAGIVKDLPANHVLSLRATEDRDRAPRSAAAERGDARRSCRVDPATSHLRLSSPPSRSASRERWRDGNVAAVTEAFNHTRGLEAPVAHEISQRRTVGAAPD